MDSDLFEFTEKEVEEAEALILSVLNNSIPLENVESVEIYFSGSNSIDKHPTRLEIKEPTFHEKTCVVNKEGMSDKKLENTFSSQNHPATRIQTFGKNKNDKEDFGIAFEEGDDLLEFIERSERFLLQH